MTVIDKLTVLPKKRRNQVTVNNTEAHILRYQPLWYSISVASYLWFLYCISHDFFVLQKTIVEVDILNYLGAAVSIALILSGTKIFKSHQTKNASQETKLPKRLYTNKLTCRHFIGYLNQRQGSKEIPHECLTCEHVIKCFSSTR